MTFLYIWAVQKYYIIILSYDVDVIILKKL